MFTNKLAGMISAVILILSGLVLLLAPGITLKIAVIILGLAIILCGISGLVSALKNKDGSKNGKINRTVYLAGSAIIIVLGIVFLAKPTIVVSILPFIMGLVIVLSGAINLVKSFQIRKAGISRWILAAVLAAVSVVLGVVIMMNPFATMKMFVMYSGFILIFNGCAGIFTNANM